MKNIHLLPTEKPSRLGYLTKKGKEVYKDLRLFDRLMPNILDSENQNIYITDHNYEFKEGRYFNNSIGVKNPVFVKIEDIKSLKEIYGDKPSHLEKIILTDNPDLIKDGVQAIDDEFLEWFVKNPSCEKIGVVKGFADGTNYGFNFLDYKIIIPKEKPKSVQGGGSIIFPSSTTIIFKPKQETLTYTESAKKEERIFNCTMMKRKQETPQEAAERIAYDSSEANKGFPSMEMFIKGTNWQSERMYSEEEVLNILYKHTEDLLAGKRVTLEEWFEQFKK